MTTLISSEIADLVDMSQFDEERKENVFLIDEFVSLRVFKTPVGKRFHMKCQLNKEVANDIVLNGCESKIIVNKLKDSAVFIVDSVEIIEDYFADPMVEILGTMIITS